MSKIPLIAIIGPTAVGKTGLSIELAKRYNGEIVSCDSMQIYKGMDIATAKPTQAEMQGIPHHLIGEIDLNAEFSVAEYVKLTRDRISDIHARGKTVFLVGGTGLYLNALVDNIAFLDVPKNDELRQKLKKQADEQGIQSLLDALFEIDEKTAKTLHPNNRGRIIRALEIYYLSGQTMSQQLESSRLEPSPYDACIMGLDCQSRQVLYDRIDQRVDKMLSCGLLDEAKVFFDAQKSATAKQAIGYKELLSYLKGETTLFDAVEKLKMETRRYAKRQLTWFRRDDRINWLYIDTFKDFTALFEDAAKLIEASDILGCVDAVHRPSSGELSAEPR